MCDSLANLHVVSVCQGFGEDPAVQPQQQQPPSQTPEGRTRQTQPPGQSGIQEVPEIVNQRMLGRIILCAGLPTFTGFALFPFFYWLRIAQGIKVPLPLVYGVQFLTFGGGLMGITYGILSASWDPRRDGSWLGLDEFKENVPNVIAGLKKRQ